jgi:DNA-binding MarR family transcriptional regulator
MVTNGNVTGLVERLVAEGLVTRTPDPTDRRTQIVALTPAGRHGFKTMAATHERWIAELFGGLDPAEATELMRLLKTTKRSAADAIGMTTRQRTRHAAR